MMKILLLEHNPSVRRVIKETIDRKAKNCFYSTVFTASSTVAAGHIISRQGPMDIAILDSCPKDRCAERVRNLASEMAQQGTSIVENSSGGMGRLPYAVSRSDKCDFMTAINQQGFDVWADGVMAKASGSLPRPVSSLKKGLTHSFPQAAYA